MLRRAAAAGYGIFLFGRYRGRGAGEDRSRPTTPLPVGGPVIVGSGLTIAGATFCPRLPWLPYFTTMGAPVAIGMVVVVLISVRAQIALRCLFPG